MGMGRISACLSDVWAISNNVGALVGTEYPSAGATYHALPSFPAFNTMAAAFALPWKTGVAGIGVFRFGDDLYNESVASLGYANRFGIASLGIKGNVIQCRAADLETRSAVTVSFGGLATLTPGLLFGAYIVNVNQPVINPITEERIITRLVAGIGIRPSPVFLASAEIEKEVQERPILRAGAEYEVFHRMVFRTGFNFYPQSGYAGIGGKFGRLSLDYAIQLSEVFGLNHQATATCHFKRK